MRKAIKNPPFTARETIGYEGFSVETVNELETFIRDVDPALGIFQKYKKGLVIQETGYIDVSEFESGPLAHLRYHILTTHGDEFNQRFPEYGALTMPRGCFFKVLDAWLVDRYALVTLLHIPEELVPYYALHTDVQEPAIVAASRQRYQASLAMMPNPALEDEYWLRRTAFPVGIDDDGSYFFQFDYGQQGLETQRQPPKGLFRRWFGK
jgi:hypothetical protein